jgi:hypothetical protein
MTSATSGPNPNISLREVAAVVVGKPAADLGGLSRDRITTIVWQRVGQDFDTGIADLAREANTTPDRLIALLTAEGKEEARTGERGVRAYWLEALLVIGVLVGVVLLARATGRESTGHLAGFQTAVTRSFAGPSLLAFTVAEFDSEANAASGMTELADRLLSAPASASEFDLSQLAPVDGPGLRDGRIAFTGFVPLGNVKAPVTVLIVRDGRRLHIAQNVGLVGANQAESQSFLERMLAPVVELDLLAPPATPDDAVARTGGLWDHLPRPAQLPAGYVLVDEIGGLGPLFGDGAVVASPSPG